MNSVVSFVFVLSPSFGLVKKERSNLREKIQTLSVQNLLAG